MVRVQVPEGDEGGLLILGFSLRASTLGDCSCVALPSPSMDSSPACRQPLPPAGEAFGVGLFGNCPSTSLRYAQDERFIESFDFAALRSEPAPDCDPGTNGGWCGSFELAGLRSG